MQTYWLAIDENNEETVHQYEPCYNKLHRKWRSTMSVYVTKGMSKIVVPDDKLNDGNDKYVIAKAFELESMGIIGNKCRVIRVLKIY